MKKIFILILSVGILGFVGCSSEKIESNGKVETTVDMSESDKEDVSYKFFKDKISNSITDGDKTDKIDITVEDILKGTVGQFKTHITTTDIENLKEGSMLEIGYSDFKSINILEEEIKFSTIYLYDDSKEAQGYSFIVKDVEKGFDGKEDIFHHLGTDINYEKVLK